MSLPKMPSITVQSVFTALVTGVVVGVAWYGIRKGAAAVGGPVQTTVEAVAAVAK